MSIVEAIAAAGVIGCGGAGFPTHVKLNSQPRYLIVNGAECEPLLRTDRYLLRSFAPRLVAALSALGRELGAEHSVIALKRSYTAEIAALEAAIAEAAAPVSLHLLESFYPAGDEQTVVYEVAGQVAPPAGIPLDVGAVVINAATLLCISDAMQGQPFVDKYLTITGEVAEPLILHVPLGISLGECITAAGGATVRDFAVLLGGPMMGKVVADAEAWNLPVTKTTSGLVVLPADHQLAADGQLSMERMVKQARVACIRCAMCSDLCPRHLLGHPIEPHKIMRSLALGGSLAELAASPVGRSAALCCECGICELVACPMGLKPRRVNGELKKLLAAAGQRYPKGAGQGPLHPWRDLRKLPTRRAAVRSGVYRYQREISECRQLSASQVSLCLRQQIGAPCQPLVQAGDSVSRGQLVAAIPEGKLGANLHASIDGIVERADSMIVIKGRQI